MDEESTEGFSGEAQNTNEETLQDPFAANQYVMYLYNVKDNNSFIKWVDEEIIRIYGKQGLREIEQEVNSIRKGALPREINSITTTFSDGSKFPIVSAIKHENVISVKESIQNTQCSHTMVSTSPDTQRSDITTKGVREGTVGDFVLEEQDASKVAIEASPAAYVKIRDQTYAEHLPGGSSGITQSTADDHVHETTNIISKRHKKKKKEPIAAFKNVTMKSSSARQEILSDQSNLDYSVTEIENNIANEQHESEAENMQKVIIQNSQTQNDNMSAHSDAKRFDNRQIKMEGYAADEEKSENIIIEHQTSKQKVQENNDTTSDKVMAEKSDVPEVISADCPLEHLSNISTIMYEIVAVESSQETENRSNSVSQRNLPFNETGPAYPDTDHVDNDSIKILKSIANVDRVKSMRKIRDKTWWKEYRKKLKQKKVKADSKTKTVQNTRSRKKKVCVYSHLKTSDDDSTGIEKSTPDYAMQNIENTHETVQSNTSLNTNVPDKNDTGSLADSSTRLEEGTVDDFAQAAQSTADAAIKSIQSPEEASSLYFDTELVVASSPRPRVSSVDDVSQEAQSSSKVRSQRIQSPYANNPVGSDIECLSCGSTGVEENTAECSKSMIQNSQSSKGNTYVNSDTKHIAGSSTRMGKRTTDEFGQEAQKRSTAPNINIPSPNATTSIYSNTVSTAGTPTTLVKIPTEAQSTSKSAIQTIQSTKDEISYSGTDCSTLANKFEANLFARNVPSGSIETNENIIRTRITKKSSEPRVVKSTVANWIAHTSSMQASDSRRPNSVTTAKRDDIECESEPVINRITKLIEKNLRALCDTEPLTKTIDKRIAKNMRELSDTKYPAIEIMTVKRIDSTKYKPVAQQKSEMMHRNEEDMSSEIGESTSNKL